MDVESSSLVGKLLIAMPDLDDSPFAGSVVYICAHSDDGGMGLIVNKPQSDAKFTDLLDQLDIKYAAGLGHIHVQFGGPVENTRGFVLHSGDYSANVGTLQVDENIGMTASKEVLEDIAKGTGPTSSMLALGYAGWGPGQLEYEIGRNGWLTCDASDEILFRTDNDQKWTAALKVLGINPILLSATAGHA